MHPGRFHIKTLMETIIRGIYKLAMDTNGLDRTIVEKDSLDIFQSKLSK